MLSPILARLLFAHDLLHVVVRACAVERDDDNLAGMALIGQSMPLSTPVVPAQRIV